MPFVCIKTDTDTCGGTNWSPSALSKLSIDGIPVALLNDVSSSGRQIVQGSYKITVNGIPVSYQGCKTIGEPCGPGSMIASKFKIIVST